MVARLTPNLAAELRTLGMLYASKAREDQETEKLEALAQQSSERERAAMG